MKSKLEVPKSLLLMGIAGIVVMVCTAMHYGINGVGLAAGISAIVGICMWQIDKPKLVTLSKFLGK